MLMIRPSWNFVVSSALVLLNLLFQAILLVVRSIDMGFYFYRLPDSATDLILFLSAKWTVPQKQLEIVQAVYRVALYDWQHLYIFRLPNFRLNAWIAESLSGAAVMPDLPQVHPVHLFSSRATLPFRSPN